MSESSIWKKLQAAQAEMKQPVFDSVNPHYGNKYASLGAVMEVVREPLFKQELFLSFGMFHDGGIITVETYVHDGNTRETLAHYPIAYIGMSHQQIGSALTYARRYSISSVFGLVADEDDDGNAAKTTPNANDAERDAAKARLWKSIQDFAEQTAQDPYDIKNSVFAMRKAEMWTAEELDAKADEFEGELV